MSSVIRLLLVALFVSVFALSGCKSSGSSGGDNTMVENPGDGNGDGGAGDGNGSGSDGDDGSNGDGNDGVKDDLVDGPNFEDAINPGYEYGKDGRPASLLAPVRDVNNTLQRELLRELQHLEKNLSYERGKKPSNKVRGDSTDQLGQLFSFRGFEGIEVFPTQVMCLTELHNTENHIHDILLGWKLANADPADALKEAYSKGLLSQLLLYTEQIMVAAYEPFNFNAERTGCALKAQELPLELPNEGDFGEEGFVYNYGPSGGDGHKDSGQKLRAAIYTSLQSIRKKVDDVQEAIYLQEGQPAGGFDPKDVATSTVELKEQLKALVSEVNTLQPSVMGNMDPLGGTRQVRVKEAFGLIEQSINRVVKLLEEQNKLKIDDVVVKNNSGQLANMYATLAFSDWMFDVKSPANKELDVSGIQSARRNAAATLHADINRVIEKIQPDATGTSGPRSSFYATKAGSDTVNRERVEEAMAKLVKY